MKSQPLILHIEQERQLRLLFSTELGKHGYVIHSVPSFEAAEAVLATDMEIYATIIGAYRDQPGGLEMAAFIIKTRPAIRTIITTNTECYTHMADILKVHACLWLPYSLTELINAVSGSTATDDNNVCPDKSIRRYEININRTGNSHPVGCGLTADNNT